MSIKARFAHWAVAVLLKVYGLDELAEERVRVNAAVYWEPVAGCDGVDPSVQFHS